MCIYLPLSDKVCSRMIVSTFVVLFRLILVVQTFTYGRAPTEFRPLFQLEGRPSPTDLRRMRSRPISLLYERPVIGGTFVRLATRCPDRFGRTG